MRRFIRSTMPVMFVLFLCQAVFADSASTNYTIAWDRFTGGGGGAASSSYEIADSSFEYLTSASMSSANYAQETPAGISGGAGIATINSVSPADYARFYSDSNASYVIGAVSEDGDSLQYSADQDATPVVSVQASGTVTWALSASDIGRHSINLYVIDPDGTTLKKQSAYVVRRPTK